ncbi:hypothetical protein ST201phi2-1p386 [Pseudomonas phage 201phi2-1]|uniref:Uncharacterized protein n=1 Tax=Pseudomonas phage 201phi2-1 TaxID=198110 RepID=B3FJP6_BP201|nr:hypothetical protein ST201phi2-1p386 [Pseudomonas phage 201phi2-1]ABY63211.1 hypothetical protein 201phi2-1p386 [Pseudomonas phage 201phi2-1]
MLEVYNAWLALPWGAKLLCTAPIIALPLIYCTHPKRMGMAWSHAWTQQINKEISATRKQHKGAVRKAEMVETFYRVKAKLALETGEFDCYPDMTPEQRYVWNYFLERIRPQL